MAFEMVETAKLSARNVAGIDARAISRTSVRFIAVRFIARGPSERSD